MSTTSGKYYNGGIKKLKAELEEKKQGLFDKYIFRPIPRELHIDDNIFLCTSCDKKVHTPSLEPKFWIFIYIKTIHPGIIRLTYGLDMVLVFNLVKAHLKISIFCPFNNFRFTESGNNPSSVYSA